MESKNKLTIVFAHTDAYGPVYACAGLGQTFLERGHRVVFMTKQTWKEKLLSYGFEVEIYDNSAKDDVPDASQHWTEFIHEYGSYLSMTSLDKIKHYNAPAFDVVIEDIKKDNDSMKQILTRVKPHVIVADTYFTTPVLMNEGVPWINLLSSTQLSYTYPGIDILPPGGSGYPINGDKNEWKKFCDETIKCHSQSIQDFNKWIQLKGVGPHKDPKRFFTESPFLNLYLCPDELDYDDVRPKPFKWHNIDCLMRDEHNEDDFVIPELLREKRGKLIYFSMGSIGSADISLMKRLISILSHSPNRFIVSKGPVGDQYELSTNMWGECKVPQTKILPLMDMVITHGGNNTVTETMLFGKPMIVMPLYTDQYDNAQRIDEKKLGIRLDPYHCEPKELLNAIETLINDEELNEKLTIISERIKNSNSKIRAAKLVEDLVNKEIN